MGITRAVFKALGIKLSGKAGSKTSCQPWLWSPAKPEISVRERRREGQGKREQ